MMIFIYKCYAHTVVNAMNGGNKRAPDGPPSEEAGVASEGGQPRFLPHGGGNGERRGLHLWGRLLVFNISFFIPWLSTISHSEAHPPCRNP